MSVLSSSSIAISNCTFLDLHMILGQTRLSCSLCFCTELCAPIFLSLCTVEIHLMILYLHAVASFPAIISSVIELQCWCFSLHCFVFNLSFCRLTQIFHWTFPLLPLHLLLLLIIWLARKKCDLFSWFPDIFKASCCYWFPHRFISFELSLLLYRRF